MYPDRAGTTPKGATPSMNRTESRYAAGLRSDPLVERFEFDTISLRLGPNLHYRPDFLVRDTHGRVRVVEVKGGYIREDALVKFKAAASRYCGIIGEEWLMVQWVRKEGGHFEVIQHYRAERAFGL
jgi:hypothetical protein